MAVASGLCFRQGGVEPESRLFWFILSNSIGIPSTWFLMRIYSAMNANIALVLCGSISFVIFQIVLWGLFQAELSMMQLGGIALVALGTAIAVIEKKRPETANILPQIPPESDSSGRAAE